MLGRRRALVTSRTVTAAQCEVEVSGFLYKHSSWRGFDSCGLFSEYLNDLSFPTTSGPRVFPRTLVLEMGDVLVLW